MWDYKAIHIELLCNELEQTEKLLTEHRDRLTEKEIEHYERYKDELGTKLVEMMLMD